MKKIILVIPIMLLLFACSFKAPEVRVTGEMTALEQEVLGTYRQVQEDETWMVASTRSESKTDTQKVSPEKKRVMDAMQDQKFNKDDIEEFKRNGYVGENNLGFLSIREHEDLQNDENTYEFVQKIVDEENRAREVIMDRVIQLNDALKNTAQENVMFIFAQMNQENSPAGTWIQEKQGEWVRKR